MHDARCWRRLPSDFTPRDVLIEAAIAEVDPGQVDRCRMTPAMADRAAYATPRVSIWVARCFVSGWAFSSDPES